VVEEEDRGMSVDKLTLVALIEGEVAKLSPRGRALWERLELHTEVSAPEEATPETLPPPDSEQVEVTGLMAELPWQEQGILQRLMMLLEGLYSSDYAERHGQPGEPRRKQAVIVAAGIKDRHEGRQVNPYMTPEEAATRLREPG
jgi:hypothetical protein